METHRLKSVLLAPKIMNGSASSRNAINSATDAAFMGRALELAARGIALASPNPLVGAVLVRDGRVIGEGFHTYEGVRHAEILALAAAGDAARGATLYINLEPCCHTGRTGPCTEALIAAGVARVVASMPDPNPQVTGRGFQQLRLAGIELEVGCREAEARRLNDAFARWILTRRPLVTLKSALTLDGQLVLPNAKRGTRAATRGSKRISENDRWISSPESRAEVQRMRHASDALLTGIGTVLVDDPLLTDRTGEPRRRKLLRVVMDSRLRLPLRSNLVRSADGDLLVFTRAKEDSSKARALRAAGVEVVQLPGQGAKPDLQSAIAELGRREILSVLLEAGAILNSAALAAEIVDKIRLFFAPKTAGSRARKSSAPLGITSKMHRAEWGLSWHIDYPSKLERVKVARIGSDTSVEGYLRNVYGTR